MCPKHPETVLQDVCGEDTCPKCSEKYYLTSPLPKKNTSWNKEEVEAYFATHLAHGSVEKFRERYKV